MFDDLLSLSIDPEVDTPEKLKAYWEVFGSIPGWTFLTGDYDKIDRVRGMDITIVTSAESDEEAYELLAAFGMPFRKRNESQG